jgi:YHS domain-containing protein
MQTALYFLVWGVAIFAMMRFGCGAHIMGHGGHGHHHGDSEGSPNWTPPEKDVDPVCGMTIETKGAKSSVHDGHVYYFCSQDCRQKFEASPTSYPARPADSAQRMEHSHEAHA